MFGVNRVFYHLHHLHFPLCPRGVQEDQVHPVTTQIFVSHFQLCHLFSCCVSVCHDLPEAPVSRSFLVCLVLLLFHYLPGIKYLVTDHQKAVSP